MVLLARALSRSCRGANESLHVGYDSGHTVNNNNNNNNNNNDNDNDDNNNNDDDDDFIG